MALLDLVAERVATGGDAIAREQSGRVVFVRGALPGERVRARLTEEHAGYARAELVEVVEAVPVRQAPPCRYVAAGCGGCGWQHVEPAAQVELKVAMVAEALRRTGGLADAAVVAGPPLAPFGFRTTLRMGVDRDGRLGFRAVRSHDLVTVGECLVAHPLLAGLVHEGRFAGATEVVLRCGAGTGERLVLVEPLRAGAAATLPAGVRRGPKASVHEVVAGVTLRVSARSFFQARADGADALVRLVLAAVDGAADGNVLVDAYAGVGLFAATVGARCEVEAIELSRSACADARHNLRGQAARVTCVDVARWHPRQAAVVVADPARTGLGRRAVQQLAATGAQRFVLVSCDAASLARDARLLAAEGFDHAGSTVVDLFPHTPHVEVVSRFDRR